MQSDWEKVKLGDIANINMGQSPASSSYNQIGNGEIFYQGNKDFGFLYPSIASYTTEPKKMADIDDVLISVRAPVGELNIANNKCCIGRGLSAIRLKDNHSRFLFYCLKNSMNKLHQVSSGTTFSSINRTDLTNLEINLPPLEIQKKIANILSILDDKIELNRKMNQTLEEMAKALFKSWFVDFEPTHALVNKKDDEDIETIASNLGISKVANSDCEANFPRKDVLELFPCELEDSELGMIPKGWGIERIENILKRYKAPKRYKKDILNNYGKTPVFEQGADILLGYHDNDGEFEATVENPMFIFGDHTCIMRLSTVPFSISANVIPLSGLIRNSYWTYYATYGQQTFQEYRRHWSELVVRKVVISDEKLADTFAEIIKPLICKIENNIKENSSLTKTRDTLLPKLLSGEIEV